MSIYRLLGIAGGVLLCVSAFTPLRTTRVMSEYFMAINDILIVDNAGWTLLAVGVLAIIAALIGRADILIVSSVLAVGASTFVAGSIRATYIQLGIYGNEAARSASGRLMTASWGWLLIVGGVVLVVAAAIMANNPRNSAAALKPTAQPTGD
jgi:hypothetical protein